MNFKKTVMPVLFLIVLQLAMDVTVHAEEEKPEIMMVYMTSDELPNARVYFIEAIFSTFAKEITLLHASQVNWETLKQQDVIVFVGDEQGIVPDVFEKELQKFEGQIIAFGHNVEQLQSFSEWDFLDEKSIRMLDEKPLTSSNSVIHAFPPHDSDIISVGNTLDNTIPFIAKKDNLSYIGTTSFGTEEKYALSRSLYRILNQIPPEKHQAYIRLEAISPISDSKLVEEMGTYLADRGISFFMAIIPVYVNIETGEQIHLAENKKLVNVLIDLQDRGGMVIAHGYSHSYRFDEPGEGFEFWDVQLNQQITTEKTDQLPLPMKSRSSFLSEEAYQAYKKKINKIEAVYINQKHTMALETLTDIGLHPIAFEAPHYAMSSNGYGITSNYFSAIFGKFQLSDTDWEEMDAPLFTSNPAILSGMTLYPETIGYVNPALPDPFQEMRESIKQLQTVPGSVIGGFYPSYIGLDYLPYMVQLIESVPNMEWLDFGQTEQFVQTDRVMVIQTADNDLSVRSSITQVNRLYEQLMRRPFEAALWIMAFVVALFILAFAIYISGLRVRLKKRLFEEREHIG